MATLRELNIKLGADTKEMERNIKSATRKLKAESRQWSNLASDMSRAVTLPILAFAGAAVKVAGDVGRFEDGLQSVMGSAEATKKELALLRKEAEKPGLDFEQAVKGSLRLQNVGFEAEGARKTLAAFGNAVALAGGTASDLDGVTLALTQIQSKGKVSAEEINQLAERVPQIRMAMQNAFGTADTEQLQKMTLSTEKFIDGVVKQLEKLPQAQSGISNEIVNTGVEFKLAMAQIGKDIATAIDLPSILSNVRSFARGAAESFASLSPSTKRIIVDLGLMAAAAGPLIKVGGMLKTSYDVAKITFDKFALAQKVYQDYMKLNAAATLEGGQAMTVFTTKTQALKKAWQSLDFATKATAIGLVVTAVAAAVVVFSELNKEMTTAEKIQATLNDVNITAAKNIAAEKIEAERLTAILKDENASREEKAAALQKLQSINQSYFGQLDLEKSKTDDINAALSTYISNIEKRAKLATANEKLINLEKQRLDLAERLNTAADDNMSFGEMWDVLLQGSGGRLETTIQKQIDAIDAQKKSLIDIINETDAAIAGGGLFKRLFKSFDIELPENINPKKPKPTKDQKDALAELAKEYDIITAKSRVFGAEMDATVMRQNAVRDAINTLLEQGVTPQDERIGMLTERYRNLNIEALGLTETQLASIEPVLALNSVLSEQNTELETVSNSWKAFGSAMTEALGSAATSMEDAAARGETSFKSLGKSALKGAADVVRAKLMEFVANVIQSTGLASGPLAPIIAPAAGAAAGLAFNRILSGLKIPALAEGAIVTSPTLALIGEKGPEIVAPPQKLPGLATMMGKERSGGGGKGYIAETKIKGSDLMLWIKEAALQEQRRTGRNFSLNS